MLNCTLPPEIFKFFAGQEASLCYQLLAAPAQAREPMPLSAYFLVFLATCVFEAPAYFLILKNSRAQFKQRLASFGLIPAVILLNWCTHPIVVFGFPAMFAAANYPTAWCIAFSEAFAPLVEGLLLWWLLKPPFARAIGAATVANLFSWSVGGYVVAQLWQWIA